MTTVPRFYTRDQVQLITNAYRDIFGPIGAELREYWDLGRKRDWGCLTTDFHNATFEQYEETTKRAIEIEETIHDPVARGDALRQVTRETGVGLSLGVCPWTDYGLFETYERNKHKGRLTIILGHDWYPIVPPLRAKKPHPVDAPLRINDEGVLGAKKYIKVGAVPAAIVRKSELLLFLNLIPDFRRPNVSVTGRFEPFDPTDGFNALVEAVSRNFSIQIISWGAPVWEFLREQVKELSERLGVCDIAQEAREWFGRPFELRCGGRTVPYLPIAHPSWPPTFKKCLAHANEAFLKMNFEG